MFLFNLSFLLFLYHWCILYAVGERVYIFQIYIYVNISSRISYRASSMQIFILMLCCKLKPVDKCVRGRAPSRWVRLVIFAKGVLFINVLAVLVYTACSWGGRARPQTLSEYLDVNFYDILINVKCLFKYSKQKWKVNRKMQGKQTYANVKHI